MSKLIDRIGINTHIDFTWTAYKDIDLVIRLIKSLGVKILRDSPNNPVCVGPNGWWQKVYDATGAKFNAYIGSGSPASMVAGLENIKKLAAQGILFSIEGPNEEDMAYAMQNGNDIYKAADFQKQVYAVGKQFNLPVINMSFGQGWAQDPQHGDYDNVGDLSAYCDYANAHTYPVPKQDPSYTVKFINSLALLAAKSRPIITTEIGFQTANDGFLETQQADLLKIGLQACLNSNAMVYVYELLDQKTGDSSDQNNFGLFHSDGTEKPGATVFRDFLKSDAITVPVTPSPPAPQIIITNGIPQISDPWAAAHPGSLTINLLSSGSISYSGTLAQANSLLSGCRNISKIEVFNQAGKSTSAKV